MTFSRSLFFLLFFNVLLLSLAMSTVKQILVDFYLVIFFENSFCFVFKESILPRLEKIQAQIIVFNKKAIVKISSISNSKSRPWNFVKFLSQFFLVDISRAVCWITLVPRTILILRAISSSFSPSSYSEKMRWGRGWCWICLVLIVN